MKETEEIITPEDWLNDNNLPGDWNRLAEALNDSLLTNNVIKYLSQYAEYYHEAKLKSSLPSEEDKNRSVYDWIMKVNHEPNSNETWAYRQGFKAALELLTKGDR